MGGGASVWMLSEKNRPGVSSTIGRRIQTCRFDFESERFLALNEHGPDRSSPQSMDQPTSVSTKNAVSIQVMISSSTV